MKSYNFGVLIKMNKTIVVISIFLTSLVLSACQEEQGRILNYKKGVYLGKKDDSLTKEQVNTLKMHTSRQRSN
jgi:hypothetical protein